MEYLYHYTKVEALEKILRSASFRLGRLDKMDDTQEARTAHDNMDLGKYCFVSSWTDNENESYGMWSTYSDLQEGVRIKMRKNPFISAINIPEEFKQVFIDTADIEDTDTVFSKFQLIGTMSLYQSTERGYMTFPYIREKILHQVIYTQEEALLNPTIVSTDWENMKIEMNKMGIYKNTGWSDQREWRYIIYAYPVRIQDENKKLRGLEAITDSIEKMINGEAAMEEYYLQLAPTAMQDMTITLAPKMNASREAYVRQLINEFAKGAKIEYSVHKDNLRDIK